MTPLELALAVLFGLSFVLGALVLAMLALVLEAVMFALGQRGGPKR